MLQLPDAVADDGLFDLTVIRKMSWLSVLFHFKVLFNGKIYRLSKTSLNRGRRIRIESSPEIALEVDGEALGYSPFEFEIIDRAVRVVVAKRFLKKEAPASPLRIEFWKIKNKTIFLRTNLNKTKNEKKSTFITGLRGVVFYGLR